MTHADVPRADPRDFQPFFHLLNPTDRRILLMLPGIGTTDLQVVQIVIARISGIQHGDNDVTFQLRIGPHDLEHVRYHRGDDYARASDGRVCALVVDTSNALGVAESIEICRRRFPDAAFLYTAQL